MQKGCAPNRSDRQGNRGVMGCCHRCAPEPRPIWHVHGGEPVFMAHFIMSAGFAFLSYLQRNADSLRPRSPSETPSADRHARAALKISFFVCLRGS